MANDVGVDVVGKVKPDRNPLRARAHRVGVGSGWNSCRTRKPHGDRSGWLISVMCPGQLRSPWGGCERPGIHEALGVDGAKTMVDSPIQFRKGIEDVGDKCGRHDAHLLKIMGKKNTK